MAYISTTLQAILNAGGNLTIENNSYTSTTLIALAVLAKQKNAHLTIKATTQTSATLTAIAAAGGKNVTIII